MNPQTEQIVTRVNAHMDEQFAVLRRELFGRVDFLADLKKPALRLVPSEDDESAQAA